MFRAQVTVGLHGAHVPAVHVCGEHGGGGHDVAHGGGSAGPTQPGQLAAQRHGDWTATWYGCE